MIRVYENARFHAFAAPCMWGAVVLVKLSRYFDSKSDKFVFNGFVDETYPTSYQTHFACHYAMDQAVGPGAL